MSIMSDMGLRDDFRIDSSKGWRSGGDVWGRTSGHTRKREVIMSRVRTGGPF